MIKLLIINTTFSQGGAAKVAKMIFNGLNKTPDFSCYFAFARGEKVNNHKVFQFGLRGEIYFHTFLLRVFSLENYNSWISTFRLKQFVKKNNFDLINLHNLHGYYLNLKFLKWLKNLKVPLVWTFHDFWPITGRCSYFFDCQNWRNGCKRCPRLSVYPKTYFLDFSSFMLKRKKRYFSSFNQLFIVSPSKWLASFIRESYLSKFEINVIPNGIETDIFKPREKEKIRKKFGISSLEKVVLFVASNLNNQRKGAKYFFESLNYSKTKNLTIVTVGKKLDSFTDLVKRKIKVKQFGYIKERRLIAQIYNLSDLFCITSLQENFPLGVLEAMASGVPVVGFKTGGIPEQVTPECGVLVKPKAVRELANAIDKVLQDIAFQRKLGENCRKRVLENFKKELFVKRYISLFRKILAKKHEKIPFNYYNHPNL